jgi:hypothetical protein
MVVFLSYVIVGKIVRNWLLPLLFLRIKCFWHIVTIIS